MWRPYVAVIDDDEGMCRAVTRLLQALDIETLTFQQGRDALEAMMRRRPDCIVLDLELPDFSDLRLFDCISHHHPTVPVVIITAWEDDELRRRAVQRGAFGYFYKPFGDDVFLGAIRSALGRDSKSRLFGQPPYGTSPYSSS